MAESTPLTTTVPAGAFALPRRRRSIDILRRLGRLPIFPVFILSLVIVCGIFAPMLEPHDPVSGELINSLQPPVIAIDSVIPPKIHQQGDWSHPLGTDHQGRDILSRIIGGAEVSLLIGVSVVIGASVIGCTIALLAGYFGGWVDQVLSRLTDTLLALPLLLVALALVAAVGPSVRNLVLVLLFMGWAGYARILRSEVLRVSASDYVRLAKITGASPVRIMLRHILPNVANTLIVLCTLQLGTVIITEASLSFLGLGVPPPDPSWGGMLADGRPYLSTSWWLAVFPGVAIMLTVLATNLLGDWLRVRFDPNFRQL